MSAVKDPNQKTTFIYSNFYHIYRKGKVASDVQKMNESAKGVVLKSSSPALPQPAEVRVVNHEESEGLKAWTSSEVHDGKKSMAEQLNSLRDASKRLKFLMTEVDEILKKG